MAACAERRRRFNESRFVGHQQRVLGDVEASEGCVAVDGPVRALPVEAEGRSARRCSEAWPARAETHSRKDVRTKRSAFPSVLSV
ncbi:hypothetical protein JOE48_005791 [Methylobacterium sp. PvR107]|nr:hypothetical protein [Methylobacterium sp. PvR107]